MEAVFRKHVGDYDQRLEISFGNSSLSRIKSLLEWSRVDALEMEIKKLQRRESTLKVFAQLLTWLQRIGRGQVEVYELRIIMLIATRMNMESMNN